MEQLYEQKLKYVIEHHLNQLQNTLFSSVHLKNPPYDIYTKSTTDISSEMVIKCYVNTNELTKIYSELFGLPLEPFMNSIVDTVGLWFINMRQENIRAEGYKLTITYDYRPSWVSFTSQTSDIFFVEISLLLLLSNSEIKYVNPVFDVYYTERHDEDLKLFYRDTTVRSTSGYVVEDEKNLPDYIKHTPLYEMVKRKDFQLLRTEMGLNKNYFMLVIPDTAYSWYGREYTWAQVINVVYHNLKD